MADERMVPLFKDGQPVSLALTPRAFFGEKLTPKDEHTMQTYADAGYTLGDRYESLELYDGPKSKRAYEREQAEKRAERSAPKADEKPAPAEARKA